MAARVLAIRLATLLALWVVWEAAARSGLFYEGIIPSSFLVLRSMVKHVADPVFYAHMVRTLYEVVAGFALGTTIGLAGGILGHSYALIADGALVPVRYLLNGRTIVQEAADTLAAEGILTEVIDLRTLVPLDLEPVLASVRKTGRCVVASQAILVGSYVNEIVARIVEEAFDDLDAPVARIGARNGISPQAQGLEAAFLPNAAEIAAAVRGLI